MREGKLEMERCCYCRDDWLGTPRLGPFSLVNGPWLKFRRSAFAYANQRQQSTCLIYFITSSQNFSHFIYLLRCFTPYW